MFATHWFSRKRGSEMNMFFFLVAFVVFIQLFFFYIQQLIFFLTRNTNKTKLPQQRELCWLGGVVFLFIHRLLPDLLSSFYTCQTLFTYTLQLHLYFSSTHKCIYSVNTHTRPHLAGIYVICDMWYKCGFSCQLKESDTNMNSSQYISWFTQKILI